MMMVRLALIVVIGIFSLAVHVQSYTVFIAGEMRRIMQRGELSPVIKLDTIKGNNTFGLGPAAGLKGELILLDGVTYVSYLDHGKIVTEQRPAAEASMFVYVSIANWQTIPMTEPVNTMESLELVVEKIAQQKGIDFSQPVPFKITVSKETLYYHVIDWEEGTPHTTATHKKFAKNGTVNNEPVTILGFYSSRHQGIVTPHTSKIHAHFLGGNEPVVGHVDGIKIENGYQLSLPDIK